MSVEGCAILDVGQPLEFVIDAPMTHLTFFSSLAFLPFFHLCAFVNASWPDRWNVVLCFVNVVVAIVLLTGSPSQLYHFHFQMALLSRVLQSGYIRGSTAVAKILFWIYFEDPFCWSVFKDNFCRSALRICFRWFVLRIRFPRIRSEKLQRGTEPKIRSWKSTLGGSWKRICKTDLKS